MIVTDNDIQFRSAHEALVFALNVTDQAYDRPMMNRLASPSVGSGQGLSGLEAAGQAGMIRAELHTLGRLAESILIARLAPRMTPCSCRSSCCSGYEPNKEWTDAISYLSDKISTVALAGCTANGMMRREYVVRYFTPREKRASLEHLAEKHDIARNTVSAHSAKVAVWFSGVQSRKGKEGTPGMESLAMEAIEDRLRSVGMVG